MYRGGATVAKRHAIAHDRLWFGPQCLYRARYSTATTHRSHHYPRKEYLRALSGLPAEPTLEGAAVLIDIETGYLSAVYGGTVEASTDFSRATQAKRQAGSFKPMVYALALEQTDDDGKPQWTTFDTLPNERRTF